MRVSEEEQQPFAWCLFKRAARRFQPSTRLVGGKYYGHTSLAFPGSDQNTSEIVT